MNCAWDLRVLAFDNPRINIPCDSVGARHLHWYWQKSSFQKDHGHTNIVVGRAIFDIEWRAMSRGGANERAARERT